jgi:hypothetical protein
MSLRKKLARAIGASQGSAHRDGLAELKVGDADYDEWDIVRDFADLETARAWRQALDEQGVDAVLTSDWPLDEWGHGEISLRVLPGHGIEVEEMLGPE